MSEHPQKFILQSTGATSLKAPVKIQDLWSGYGSIMRYALEGADAPSVIVKHVRFPDGKKHPRGWDTNLSHARKVHSYLVETHWYQHWSSQCSPSCYVPHCYAVEKKGEEVLMVFEDLDASGFEVRRKDLTAKEMRVCLKWLAHFHATFMNRAPEGLWEVGTYWHLATRPDELKALKDSELRSAASEIDQRLSASKYLSIVHGDAKLANFCFSADGKRVAAVDFQYVGGGCGMKDVAYFVGSCLYDEDCEKHEAELLDYYFSVLTNVLKAKHPEMDAKAVEEEWRTLFPYAWADFHRFIKGWSPGHWKIHGYSERVARKSIGADMELTKKQLQELTDIAIKASLEAGKIIARFQGKSIPVQEKEGGSSRGSQIVTEVDHKAQEQILKTLEPATEKFQLGLLTEELPDDGSRFEKDYFWCIDPLDGTLPFIENRPGYAVSIALVSKAGESVLGVVYDPLTKTLYHAFQNGGVYKNQKEWRLPQKKDTTLKFFRMGGAVMNACWVLENPPALCHNLPKPERGGGCHWDYAATTCLYQELGAWVSDASGKPLHLNSKDSVYMNQTGVLFASDPEIAASLLKK